MTEEEKSRDEKIESKADESPGGSQAEQSSHKAEAKSEKKQPSKANADGKKSQARRSWLGPWQIIGLCMIAVAAVWQFGTEMKGADLLIKPRQIRCSFVDENGRAVPDVVAERSVGTSLDAVGGSWEKLSESDMAGKLEFVIGGRTVKVFNKQYVWGLYKKQWREGDYVAYRFAKGNKSMPPVLEEQLLTLKEAGRVDPNETDFAGKLDENMIGDDGKIGYSVINLALVKGRIDPNALPQRDPNAMVSQ